MNDQMILRTLVRLAAFCSAFFGAWIWWFHSFDGPSAFTIYGNVPEPAFAVPLITGAALICFGDRRGRPWALFLGLLVSLTIFLAAEISCAMANLKSTGVPAYLDMCLFYGVLLVCVGLKRNLSEVRT